VNIDEEALSKRHLPVWGGLGERRHSAVLQRRSDLVGFRKGLRAACTLTFPFIQPYFPGCIV